MDGGQVSVLQFGATGQLARASIRAAAARPQIRLRALARDVADFRAPESAAMAVWQAERLDVVINATAYTAVDKAESEEALAHTVNAEAVGVLAEACRARGVPLIHISTDYVFDGIKPAPYREDDPTRPLGAYGRTKLAGEDAIRARLDRHAIVRTSWIYSADGANFVKTMLRLGAEREELRVVDDQHGAPTAAAGLAEALLTIAERIARGAPAEAFGTFHYSDAGETTWRRFAEAIFAGAPWANIRARVVPIPTADYPTPARRPQNSRLDCAKIEHVYDIRRQPWQPSLTRVLDEIATARRGDGT
jgi:dTDP-4-dehydrorhamnose reductase